MDAFLLLARLTLAGVFSVSGAAKLADLTGTRDAIFGFGISKRYSMPIAIGLPLAEIICAFLLLPVDTAWWAALGTLLLLGAFIAGIVYNLRQGRTPDCHCFGQLHSEPIGPSTLVRNGLLSGVALFIVLFGWGDTGLSTVAWFQDFSGSERLLTFAASLVVAGVAAEAWFMFQMVKQNGRVLLRLDSLDNRLASQDGHPDSVPAEPEVPAKLGLPPGSAAPSFEIESVYGQSVSLDSLLAPGNPTLLVFSTPTCKPCSALMPEIGRWQRDHSDLLTISIIGQGEPAANRAKTAEHGLTNVLLQKGTEVSVLYDALVTPTAVLVSTDGTIGASAAAGADAIRDLVDQIVATRSGMRVPVQASNAHASTIMGGNGAHALTTEETVKPLEPTSIEQPVELVDSGPIEFALPDLDGKSVALRDFAGQSTVLLFWNPGCGYCQRMLDDLKSWEENSLPDSPRLLVVSAGTVEENRGQELRSLVVIDPGFEVGKAYGIGGTPSALRLNEQGIPVGPTAIGSSQVLALLNGEEIPIPEPTPPLPELQVGVIAPEFSLPNLDDDIVSLADFEGRKTAVLFWSPGCIHCQRMIDDLRAWEADPPDDAPALLVVSGGDLEANRAAGLNSPILIDSTFDTGRSYGATGTPSGVVVSADGRIDNKLVVGADNFLALVGYVSAECKECLATCLEQGGGEACSMVCQMGGQCP